MEHPVNNAPKGSNGYDFLKNQSNESNYISNIVNQCFNKKFSFDISELWELPPRSQGKNTLGEEFDKKSFERWQVILIKKLKYYLLLHFVIHCFIFLVLQIDELEQLKFKLNNVKSKLNSYNFGDWHKHTRSRNPAGLVMRDLRNFEIELLTQVCASTNL